MSLSLGEIAYSKAGRDAEKTFIIIEILDNTFVQISDGDLRKIEKPKKKKIKHLILTGEIIDSLKEKLENKQKITNAEIRKTLIQYKSEKGMELENKVNIQESNKEV